MDSINLHLGYPMSRGPDWLAMASLYRNAKPFPHVVVDGFLDKFLAKEVMLAVRKTPESAYKSDSHPDQRCKMWVEDYNALPTIARETLLWFNSGTALALMEHLTGIKGLIPDNTFYGGGVHRMGRGGLLSVHCDFNEHPHLKLYRRVNALLFLNEGWQPTWRGELELWSSDMARCERRVLPDLNRLAVFTITDDAFHGVPQEILCPQGSYRYSLALYYYTADRPRHEKTPPHLALWQKSKGP